MVTRARVVSLADFSRARLVFTLHELRSFVFRTQVYPRVRVRVQFLHADVHDRNQVHAGELAWQRLQGVLRLGVIHVQAGLPNERYFEGNLPPLGHVGQQADLIFNFAVCGCDIAPAQDCHFTNSQICPVREQHHGPVTRYLRVVM